MKCRSEKILLSDLHRCNGFTLIEVLTALAILALVSSAVLVVINRCMASAANLTQRYHAFEVARENMEKLLAGDSAEEMVEYGSSDKYPQIQWQTTVEAFYEPITERMWIQAVCSAEYTDTDGELQTVELTHWLTDLTKSQVMQIVEEKQKGEELLAEQIIETEEDAADYAGVDVQTIQQWVSNGMPRTENGDYVRAYLDLYKEYNGAPPVEIRDQVVEVYEDLLKPAEEPGEHEPEQPEGPKDNHDEKLICGYTVAELSQMPFDRLWQILRNCDELR